jgi:hypothetical protein
MMIQVGERNHISSCLSRSRSQLRRAKGKRQLDEWMGFDFLPTTIKRALRSAATKTKKEDGERQEISKNKTEWN